MALRFRTRLSWAVGLLIAATVIVMTVVLVSFAFTSITQLYRARAVMLTRLANRNVEYGLGVPGKVMDRVADQMVVSALLLAELVDVAENQAGLAPEEVSQRLRRVRERSRELHGHPLVDEFWVTDSRGRAYIHTDDAGFRFTPDSHEMPQASAFWPLLEGRERPVVQELASRSRDGKPFSYVGVTGVDKPRIVQVGAGKGLVESIKSDFRVQHILDQFVKDMEVRQIVVFDGMGEVVAATGEDGKPLPGPVDAEIVGFCMAYLNAQRGRPFDVTSFGPNIGVVTPLEYVEGGQGALFIEYYTGQAFSLLRDRVLHVLLIAAVMVLAGVGVSTFMARSLSRPILQLADAVREFANGKLNHRVQLRTGDDLQVLGDGFNVMAESLQVHMKELERETKKRERLESELRIAAEMQRSLLPKAPPDVPGIEVAGWSRPARQVGGDFYDYVELGGRRLAVAIGDATGKGLTAALLTTECWSVFRALAGGLESPAELLARTNRALCARLGDTGRFVTLFLMIVDLDRMVLRYSIAGHNPPILTGVREGRRRMLGSREGLPLGVVTNASFTDIEVELEAGDTIVLYSDGLPEAPDPDGARYGDERLVRLVEQRRRERIEEVLNSIRRDVADFMRGNRTRDDMTVVAARVLE